MAKKETRSRGLYKNGKRWWVRSVRGPMSGTLTARSTGTHDLRIANLVAGMLATLRDERQHWDLLELAAKGEIGLDVLYNHFASSTLNVLRDNYRQEQQRRIAEAVVDPEMTPYVDAWEIHLRSVDLEEKTRREYLRQVRYLTAGLSKSTFTDESIKERLHALQVQNSTKKRFIAALKLFFRWARKRVPIEVNPFEDADWIPANNPPRFVFYEHNKVLEVLGKMNGVERVAMTLVFGSGIELGALLTMRGGDVSRDGDPVITARGTKNEHRMDRTLIVDQWAWKSVREYTRTVLPSAPLWPWRDGGKALRESFYAAQVEAGFVEEPPKSPTTGKRQWGAVNPHTIHDARHSYVLNRLVGGDGEPRQDIKFCAAQLGHADEQMVMRVYAKLRVDQRQRLSDMRRAGVRIA